MGVFIGQSTKIVDRATGEIFYRRSAGQFGRRRRLPAGQAVAQWRAWAGGLYCAVIVKRVDARTRSKTSINELLRD